MEKANRYINRHAGLALMLTIMAGFPAIGSANWTAAGSTGTVDEADTGLVVFGSNTTIASGFVRLRSTAPLPARADIRYNVTAVGSLLKDPSGIFNSVVTMKVRYRDNGAGNKVIVRLKQYNLNTGNTKTLLRLDSASFGASPSFQVQSAKSDCKPLDEILDFTNNSYFVDVELQKTQASGNPALAMIQLEANNPCP
jgi:hypothetical protein